MWVWGYVEERDRGLTGEDGPSSGVVPDVRCVVRVERVGFVLLCVLF